MRADRLDVPAAVGGQSAQQPRARIARRNWVLGEMLKHNYITKAVYEQAIAEPNHAFRTSSRSRWMRRISRKWCVDKYSTDSATTRLTEGYVVKTTVQSARQQAAVEALRDG
jgi:penicillin-binding protein 1A